MRRRQPLPHLWLMTDERLGGLPDAVARLPEGGGIVFRHYGLQPAPRRALFDQVKSLAEARSQMLLLAGPHEQAIEWGADGSHGRGPGAGFRSAPAHNLEEMRDAEGAGAALIFLSPVFATRSHPGADTLGAGGFNELAARTHLPVIALGGMDGERFALLDKAYGWAGIDAWAP